MNQLFRALPSMDACLAALTPRLPHCPRPLLRQCVGDFLDVWRERIRQGQARDAAHLTLDALLPEMAAFATRHSAPRLRRVLNATGVVIHTNMGRSVLAEEAVAAVTAAARNYSNLELDLSTGGRGSRHDLVEALLHQLTGAEAALVVNNNAAAVLLILDSLCAGGEVVVSRGQLVEIGGSFRIPEVMEKGGARLKEVGTTNRTHLRDYAGAITEHTVALLKVHTSNYRVVGFHADVSLEELCALGAERGLPVIEDLGSGSLLDFSAHGLPNEPTVQDAVRAGADVVSFSGDKVLGGPQAGIIVGKGAYIQKLRANQLLRALRPDKLTLAALEATLRLYLDPELARQRVPTPRMICADPAALRRRAKSLQRRIRSALGDAVDARLRDDVSRVGGGSFPERDLKTTLVCLAPTRMSATELRQRLLAGEPPLMGRLDGDAFCLDVRTLPDADYADAVTALRHACGMGD